MSAEPQASSRKPDREGRSKPRVVRFGIFELDRRSGELRRQGRRVALGEKPLQLLLALLDRPGDVVLREELQERLWPPGVHVDFERNLNTAATNLRSVLGDAAASPRFIETVPKRGYRFIAPVEGGGETAPAAGRRPLRALIVGLGTGLALAAGWALLPKSAPTPAPTSRQLVAVLPFTDLSPEPGASYLSDGLTEELIAELGRLRPDRIGVIARMSAMSYKDTDKRADEVARELGADLLVEGSLRRADGRVRMIVQLVRPSDQTQLWSTTFEEATDDLLEVQVDLAARAAQALAATLLPNEPAPSVPPPVRNAEAFDAYLQGRYEWNRFEGDGYRAALEHLQRAVELEPTYALAWAGLADAHNLLAFDESAPAERFPQARAAAERALELDPESAEAHNALAFVRLYRDFDVERAEASFARALELNPNLAMAHHWRAGALAALGRTDDAVASMRRAVELDPRALSVLSDLGWYLIFADRYEEAVTECRRTLAIKEGYGWASLCLFEAHYVQGQSKEALEVEMLRLRQQGAPSERLEQFASLYPESAIQAIFDYHLEQLEAAEEITDPIAMALGLLRTGDRDGATGWLERAVEERNGWVLFLEVDPRFDRLRNQDLLPQIPTPPSRERPSTG